MVSSELDPETALNVFMSLFMDIVNRHVPLKKLTVKNRPAPWLDNNLRALMNERDLAKKAFVNSGSMEDKLRYCQLRNNVTKLNKMKKRDYYKQRLYDARVDGKKWWNVLNDIMGRKSNVSTPFVESNGLVVKKPGDIAYHFNDYYISKVVNLRQAMGMSHNTVSSDCIKNVIMKDKNCEFYFHEVGVEVVERLLSSLPDSKLAGLDNLDSKLLRMTASIVASLICHIFNRCLITGLCPSVWKEAKVIPLPKDTKNILMKSIPDP